MKNMFVGLLLIFLDITLNISLGWQGTLDILPDFVGYILILRGAGEMAEVSPSFAKINPAVWAATAVSAISFLLNLFGLSAALLSDGLPAQILQTAILLAEEILLFWVTWQMASGIRDMEYHYGTWMNAEDVTVAWKLMVGFYAAGFVFSRLAVLLMAPLNLVATLFLILLVIGNVAVNIFFLVQFYKAKKAYDMLPG